MQRIQTDNVIVSKAFARYVRVSPFKVRRMVRAIQGMSIVEALDNLAMLRHHSSAGFLFKVLSSAVANAKHNQKFEGQLKIERILVDQALIMKRAQPRSRGRAFPIKKRLSHIAVFLSERKGS